MLDVVCAVIQRTDGRVLAAQRPPGKAQAGRWEFPGGKIEDGETAATALIREIREELGCDLRVGAPLTPVNHPYPGGVIRLHPFLAEIIAGQPEPHEHTALRWVDSNTAATLEWAPADLPVLAELWSRPTPQSSSHDRRTHSQRAHPEETSYQPGSQSSDTI